VAGKSTKEVIEGGKLKRFMDPRIVKALGHPIREHLLAVFNERIASGSEIGEEIDADVSSFYHHVEELEKLGCIELVETKQRRGGREHFFEAKATGLFDDRAWENVPATVRMDLTVDILQRLFDDVIAALEAKILSVDPDQHVSWTPSMFDAQGWDEVKRELDETLKRVTEIRRKSSQRLELSGERGMPATIGILAFKMPAPEVGSSPG
jgi:predicted transcriptional regulator